MSTRGSGKLVKDYSRAWQWVWRNELLPWQLRMRFMRVTRLYKLRLCRFTYVRLDAYDESGFAYDMHGNGRFWTPLGAWRAAQRWDRA
jgi:hypothetical protein